MHKREEVLTVAAQLMAADVPAFSRELQMTLNFGAETSKLIIDKCDAYVALAVQLVESVDRWQKKQPKPEATLPPRKLPAPDPNCV